ncbi:MAG TPA: hypothetical protein ENI60_07635 [Candidatus Fraserbacteria bacterium]|nr:hypothetical protein [Candidatus Fraserbacteria bacterium]
MKRTSLLIGLGALLLALALAQPGVSQMGNPPPPTGQKMAPAQNPEKLQLEIQLLRALDMAGLSPTQLKTLHTIVTGLQEAQSGVQQAQQQLKDFLVGFPGDSSKFAQAVAPYDQRVTAAHQALRTALTQAVDQVKNLLTISQGEALLKALRPLQRRMMHGQAAMASPVACQTLRFDFKPHLAPKAETKDEQEQSMMQNWREKIQALMQFMSKETIMTRRQGQFSVQNMPMEQMLQQMQQMMRRMHATFRSQCAPAQAEWSQLLAGHLELLQQVLQEKLAKLALALPQS